MVPSLILFLHLGHCYTIASRIDELTTTEYPTTTRNPTMTENLTTIENSTTTENSKLSEFDYGRKFNTTERPGTFQATFGIDIARMEQGATTLTIPATEGVTTHYPTTNNQPPVHGLDCELEEWLIKAAKRTKNYGTEKPWAHKGDEVQDYFDTFIHKIGTLRT